MISVEELSNTKLKMVRRREMTKMMTMEKTWSANTQWRMMERKNKRKMRRLKRERVTEKEKGERKEEIVKDEEKDAEKGEKDEEKKEEEKKENETAAMQVTTAIESKMDMRIGGWTLDRTFWNLP